MECKFHVGQKVVCINDTPDYFNLPGRSYIHCGLHGLTKNNVYTIRGIQKHASEDDIILLLEEIYRPESAWTIHYKQEAGYDARRFKPLETKKTDISIFTDMLNKKIEFVEYDVKEKV